MYYLISGKVWKPTKKHNIEKTLITVVRDNQERDNNMVECEVKGVSHNISEGDHVAFIGSWKKKNQFSARAYLNITKSKTWGNNAFFPVAIGLGWFIITAICLDLLHLREFIYYGTIVPIALFLFLTRRYRITADMLEHFNRYNHGQLDGSHVEKREVVNPKVQRPVRYEDLMDDDSCSAYGAGAFAEGAEGFVCQDDVYLSFHHEIDLADRYSGNFYGASEDDDFRPADIIETFSDDDDY